MFHNLYFTETTPIILVLGGTFSALELMPLVIIGFEAYENCSMVRLTPWVKHYKWPIYWFVTVTLLSLGCMGCSGLACPY